MNRQIICFSALLALSGIAPTGLAAGMNPAGEARSSSLASSGEIQGQSRGQQFKGEEQERSRILLVDFKDGDERPKLAVYALDRSFKLLHLAKVDARGNFELPDKVLSAAHLVAIGPITENFAGLDRATLTQYRSAQFTQMLGKGSDFLLPRQTWLGWNFVFRCVQGSVSHCFPHPWVINDFVLRASLPEASPLLRDLTTSTSSGVGASPGRVTAIGDAVIAESSLLPILFPFRCDEVCDGLVEVYRRTCCCLPIVVFDPRIPEIIVHLEEILPDPPPIIKWPPGPRPDPPPWSELSFLKDGGLNEKLLYARRDLQALRTLDGAALAEYIQARPYLFCFCGSPVKVAQGFIQPDGDFTICWIDRFHMLRVNCHDEYAFVVKQVIAGSTVTIYDGLAANQWFDYGEEADLVSYHPSAIGCRSNEFPGAGAFALLQDLGDTESYHMKTPDATGWDRVAVPVYNDGLVFPAPNPVAAEGKMLDRNWGGTILLRYHFSEGMKGIGARYYRVSAVASDAIGNPTGQRTYLSDGVTWSKYVAMGPNINVEHENLGPNTVAGTPNLFKIPYDADASWQSGQYHARLKTTRPEFTNGRYLFMLEVFNSVGQKLKPTSAPSGDPGIAVAFTFRRWYQEVGPTAEVPFGALTHMLWWDNRHAVATIVDLRVNATPNTEECQFLESAGTSLFSSGYRAYHPEPMFQLYHRMWWRRGLGGPSGSLTSPTLNPNNVGKPPAPPGVSGTATFADMLGLHAACSFSLNLRVWVKTFDGRSRLSGLDDWDQAAFALSVTSGP